MHAQYSRSLHYQLKQPPIYGGGFFLPCCSKIFIKKAPQCFFLAKWRPCTVSVLVLTFKNAMCNVIHGNRLKSYAGVNFSIGVGGFAKNKMMLYFEKKYNSCLEEPTVEL